MSAHARLQRKKSRDAEHEHVPVFAPEPIATQRALPALQPKLTISQPGDMYEQEAERVADQVLRMPDPAIQRSADDDEPEEEPLLVSPADQQPIQRAAAPDEIEAAQPLAQPDEDDQLVQRAADGALAAAPPAEARITALQGGQPLDAATRAFMEPRFGHDFSQVRVHTGAEAAEAARSVNALAYTLGSDVVFGAGQYQPGTEAGRRLLAHELTHVVQQAAQVKPNEVIYQRQVTDPVSTVSFQDEPITSTPGSRAANTNLRYFLDRAWKYLQNLRDANQEACITFAHTMFHETNETANPHVMSAVLKKAFDMAKKQAVDVVKDYIPGFSEFVDLLEAASNEVERSNKAQKEAKLVDFINIHVMDMGQKFQELQEKVQSPEMMDNLIAASGDSDITDFAQKAYDAGNKLKAPRNSDILLWLIEAYIRRNESTRMGGIFGVDLFATSVLYLKYEVDEHETKAELVEKKLSSPYAPQILSLLRQTIGDWIDTSELNFTRIVYIVREDMHFISDTWKLRAGEKTPPERGQNYFSKLVKVMPILYISHIEAEQEEVLVG